MLLEHVVGMGEIREIAAGQFILAVTEHVADHLIDIDNATLQVDKLDADGGLVERQLKTVGVGVQPLASGASPLRFFVSWGARPIFWNLNHLPRSLPAQENRILSTEGWHLTRPKS